MRGMARAPSCTICCGTLLNQKNEAYEVRLSLDESLFNHDHKRTVAVITLDAHVPAATLGYKPSDVRELLDPYPVALAVLPDVAKTELIHPLGSTSTVRLLSASNPS